MTVVGYKPKGKELRMNTKSQAGVQLGPCESPSWEYQGRSQNLE
jgi:hypothetical protein